MRWKRAQDPRIIDHIEGHTTAAPPPPPGPTIGQAALANLLLSPAEVDTTLGLTGTASVNKIDKLQDDAEFRQLFPAGWKFPDECIYATNPAMASVYAGSGNTAVSGEHDSVSPPPGSNDPKPEVRQAEVLFPSANEANAFFTTSAQRWPACANRALTPPGTDNLIANFAVGPVANANGILTTTVNVKLGNPDPGGAPLNVSCQRALTVRGNVAIDVNGCRTNPGDLAVNVANQIAGKIDNQGKVDAANINTLAASLAKGYNLTNCHPAAPDKLTFLSLAEIDCGQNPDPSGPASAVYRLLVGIGVGRAQRTQDVFAVDGPGDCRDAVLGSARLLSGRFALPPSHRRGTTVHARNLGEVVDESFELGIQRVAMSASR